jgi:ATP-dependent helicase/nuclease subunit A
LLMAPLTQRGQDGPSVYRYLNAVDAERQRYETIRLLYVAATRSKHQLHLLGRFRYHPKSGCSATAGSFMQLLLPAFESAMAAREFQPGQSAERAPEVLPLPLLRLVAAPMIGLQGASLEQAAMPPLPDLPDRDATALGQALHTWLELIHDHAGMAWSGDWFDAQRPMLESLLLRCGAAEDRLGALLPRLLRMLRLAVDSDAAVPPADQSHAELKLFRREGSRISQHVIDRLYLDRAGQWQIIDYKTGEANPEVMARWRGQLGRYAALVDAVTAAGLPACRVYQAERGELLPIAPQADQ